MDIKGYEALCLKGLYQHSWKRVAMAGDTEPEIHMRSVEHEGI